MDREEKMHSVWITNLRKMNTTQTIQIKSNKMMVEKMLQKRERKKWKTNIMFLSNIFWHFCIVVHSRKPAEYNNEFWILFFRSFYLLCSIRWPLSAKNWMLSLSKMNSLSITLFFHWFSMQFKELRNKRLETVPTKIQNYIWIDSIRSLNK